VEEHARQAQQHGRKVSGISLSQQATDSAPAARRLRQLGAALSVEGGRLAACAWNTPCVFRVA